MVRRNCFNTRHFTSGQTLPRPDGGVRGRAGFPLVVRAGHHYLVPRSGGRIIAGSTMEYKGFEKAVTGEGLRSILEGAVAIAPVVKDLRFRAAWSGLRPDTEDHLPILGYGEITNLVFATGHFRNGILLTPITAQLISELILKGSTSRPLERYSPARFRPGYCDAGRHAAQPGQAPSKSSVTS